MTFSEYMYAVIVHKTFKYFFFKWSTSSVKHVYNHMVGRTASVISPFYSLLPGQDRSIVSSFMDNPVIIRMNLF